jgi:hypothetical protein
MFFQITVTNFYFATRYLFDEFCGLFVDFKFSHITSSERVAIADTNSYRRFNPIITHKKVLGASGLTLTFVTLKNDICFHGESCLPMPRDDKSPKKKKMSVCPLPR